MKATREELIDFFKWIESECYGYDAKDIAENQVDLYLKSINSEVGNETPTVTDNEAKGKYCRNCGEPLARKHKFWCDPADR